MHTLTVTFPVRVGTVTVPPRTACKWRSFIDLDLELLIIQEKGLFIRQQYSKEHTKVHTQEHCHACICAHNQGPFHHWTNITPTPAYHYHTPIWIQTSDQQTYMLAPSNTVIWTSAHSPLPIPGACECPWHWPTPCLAMPTCTCCHPTHTLLQWCPFTVYISRWPL
jgi:hypothetical protein